MSGALAQYLIPDALLVAAAIGIPWQDVTIDDLWFYGTGCCVAGAASTLWRATNG